MNFLKQFLTDILRSGNYSDAKIEEDSILEGLSNESIKRHPFFISSKGKPLFYLPYHKGARFVMIIATLAVVVTFVFHYSFVYIKEVLLYSNSISTTRAGSVIFSKSLGREYGIFLFNTSDLWADTGISLSSQDCLRISFSGAFHSSIGDLKLDTENNSGYPLIRWIGDKYRDDMTFLQKEKQVFSLYHNANGYIGSILYAVVPEYKIDSPVLADSLIRVWTRPLFKEGERIKHGGRLVLAVNDIYFRGVSSLNKYKELFGDKRFDYPLPGYNSGSPYRLFYEDNLGQILVCAEIHHQLKGPLGGRLWSWLNPRLAYRWLETNIERSFFDDDSTLRPWLLSIIFLIGFTLWIALIILFWITLILASIYALFFIGYQIGIFNRWLKSLIRQLYRNCRTSQFL